jgi:AraC-like DNA-binding protein
LSGKSSGDLIWITVKNNVSRLNVKIFSENQPFLFGQSHYPKGGNYGPIDCSHLDLFILEKGRAKVKSDGKTYYAETGRAYFFYSEYSIEVAFPSNTETLMSWVETGELLVSPNVQEQLRMLPRSVAISENLSELLLMGVGLKNKKGFNFQRMRNALAQTAFYEYFYLANLVEEEKPLPEAVLRAKSHIDENFKDAITLHELAEIVKLNPNYLISVFKKYLGFTPIQYLWQKRAEMGIQLLYKSGLSVSEIAFRCGFQYPNHFTRHLKNHYGYTPRELRSHRLQHEPDRLNETVREIIF